MFSSSPSQLRTSSHQPLYFPFYRSIGPVFPRASFNFHPIFPCPLLEFFPASSFCFSLKCISCCSSELPPSDRVRLYRSESVSRGLRFTHVLPRLRPSLLHIHQCCSINARRIPHLVMLRSVLFHKCGGRLENTAEMFKYRFNSCSGRFFCHFAVKKTQN